MSTQVITKMTFLLANIDENDKFARTSLSMQFVISANSNRQAQWRESKRRVRTRHRQLAGINPTMIGTRGNQ
jgi:hypothetical protein